MNISENHNTSVGKYGEELTRLMEKNGIIPKYLLSSCRFHMENKVPIKTLSLLFKQWNTYVMRNNPIDVNTLTYNEFREMLNKCKRDFGIPNKVYDDGQVSIGEIHSNKDIERFPLKNNLCIKYPREYAKYINQGFKFYMIDNGDESDYVRYVILMVGRNGEKSYYDLDNSQLTERSVNVFQSHLTPNALSFIQNINTENNQEIKENRNMNKKQKIRINENQLRRIVTESVKRVLNEIGYNQFSDDDFGGSGDPYGLVDSDIEESNDSLDGYYDTFNNISVRIVHDGKPNVAVAVSAKGNGNGNGRVVFRGVEAQEILNKIKSGAEEYGNINISMYRNLYKYVL